MTEVVEKEVEIVAGTIGGVTLKREGVWQVHVKPENSEYAKGLWTKDAELVNALSKKLGEFGAFVCNASYWQNQDGKQVRSLWIDHEGDDGESTSTRATPVAAAKDVQRVKTVDGLSKEEWRRKDLASDKRAYTAIASAALQHTMPSTPTKEELNTFLDNVSHLTIAWLKVHNALRDGEDVPF